MFFLTERAGLTSIDTRTSGLDDLERLQADVEEVLERLGDRSSLEVIVGIPFHNEDDTIAGTGSVTAVFGVKRTLRCQGSSGCLRPEADTKSRDKRHWDSDRPVDVYVPSATHRI